LGGQHDAETVAHIGVVRARVQHMAEARFGGLQVAALVRLVTPLDILGVVVLHALEHLFERLLRLCEARLVVQVHRLSERFGQHAQLHRPLLQGVQPVLACAAGVLVQPC